MEKNLFKSFSLPEKWFGVAFTTILIHCVLLSKAQNEINVDNSKGVASVTIPLSEWQIPGFKSSVSLNYTAKSVKVRRAEGDMPIGWTLEGNGTIDRILKGLPDEYQNVGDARKGWMNTGIQGLAETFQISDDNDPNNCTDEGINRTSIFANWGYTLDSEPDWFIVNAPGLSCKLILDNNNTFRALPAQDLKIEFLDQTTNDPYFVITNTDGVKYTFRTSTKTTRQLNKVYTNVNFNIFNREYEYFKTPLTYITTWYLDRINTNGSEKNYISFEYASKVVAKSITQSVVTSLNTTGNKFSAAPIYTTSDSGIVSKLWVGMKSSTGQVLTISPNSTRFDLMNSGSLSSITAYSDQGYLKDIRESNNNCVRSLYYFTYYGFDGQGLVPRLPYLASDKYDAWGYFNNLLTKRQLNVFPSMSGTSGIYRPYPLNGYTDENYSLNGSDPVIDEVSITSGMLSKITYPNGGSSYFEYESNSFWDQDGNVEIKGSGARIKKITHFDGISPTRTKVLEYTYNIPGQTRTSGTIKSLPQIALITNYFSHPTNAAATLLHSQVLGLVSKQSADYWKYLTLIADNDRNEADETVSYQYVTVKEQGNGRTEYQYTTPSNLWSIENNSRVYSAMDCTSGKVTGLPVKNGFVQYPFPPKEDLEYAEGLNVAVKSYTEVGGLVKTNEYEYEDYTVSPQQIYGLAFDNLYGNLLFGRYGIVVNAKVLKKEKETFYDTGLTGNSTYVEALYDNSAPDKTVRSKTVVDSDNTILKTSYKYSGDFTLSAGQVTSDPFAEGIYLLNQNYMKTVPLEEVVWRQESEATSFKVYSGTLSLYRKNALSNLPVLSEKKTLISSNGLAGFSNLSFSGTSLSYNPSYKSVLVMSDHNLYDMPGTLTENGVKKSFSYFNDIKVPFATFYGCELNNVVFTGFEEQTGSMQTVSFSPTDISNDAHTGNSAGILRSGNELTQNFVKLSGTQNYTLSFWAKNTAGGNVNVQINNTTVATITLGNADKYVFYQENINVSAIPDNSNIKLTTIANIKIDNIGFYPQDVQYEMSTYRYPAGKTSQTNSSGSTVYNDYDNRGRLIYVRDVDKNILKYKRYNDYNAMLLSSYFSPSSGIISNNVTFSVSNPCLSGVKYIWNFGDGTTLETYNEQVPHTFADGGPYTVTLTASHPYYNEAVTSTAVYKTALKAGFCVAGAIHKDLCNKKPTAYGDCSSSYPAPSSGATAYIKSLSGCPPGTTYQYKWSLQSNNGPWQWVGTNQNNHWVPQQEGWYNLKCLITSSFGTSTEVIIQGINYYRSQNCPIREE